MKKSKTLSNIKNNNLSLPKYQLIIENLLNYKKKYIKKSTNYIPYLKESSKDILWQKYLFNKKPVSLLFSIEQFLFEFLKRTSQSKKYSEYKYQLKELKKLKIFYGSLATKQLFKILDKNLKYPGYFSNNFLSMLERRLDIILYRSNFTKNIYQARQLITHKKIYVNNVIVTSPSFILNPGDIISVENKTSSILKKNLKNTLKENSVVLYSKLKEIPALHNVSQKNLIVNNKKNSLELIYNLVQLFLKKVQETSRLKLVKNPYNKLSNFQFLVLIQSTRNSKFEQKQGDNGFLKDSQQIHRLSGKADLKDSLYNLLQKIQLPNLSQELFFLMLKKFIKQKPSRKQTLNSLQHYAIRPLHLEISYRLMKIVYLYPPQRIYYPFYINTDILKRYKN